MPCISFFLLGWVMREGIFSEGLLVLNGPNHCGKLSTLMHVEAIMVKLSVYTPWKYMGGADVYLHSFLTSTPDVGDWSSFPMTTLSEGKELMVPNECVAGLAL
jgi:hypothetical protein